MSATLTQIREALAEALQPIDGFQKLAHPKTVPADKSLAVILDRINYQVAFQSDAGDYSFRVRAFIATGIEEASQGILDDLLEPAGTQSVYAALTSDPTLGGVVATLKVLDGTGPEPVVTQQGTNGLVSVWQVEVWT